MGCDKVQSQNRFWMPLTSPWPLLDGATLGMNACVSGQSEITSGSPSESHESRNISLVKLQQWTLHCHCSPRHLSCPRGPLPGWSPAGRAQGRPASSLFHTLAPLPTRLPWAFPASRWKTDKVQKYRLDCNVGRYCKRMFRAGSFSDHPCCKCVTVLPVVLMLRLLWLTLPSRLRGCCSLLTTDSRHGHRSHRCTHHSQKCRLFPALPSLPCSYKVARWPGSCSEHFQA